MAAQLQELRFDQSPWRLDYLGVLHDASSRQSEPRIQVFLSELDKGYVQGREDRDALDLAAREAMALASGHQGSRSLDGVGHAAVSASYAVANALAGRAAQAADYAAYAAVYGGGGYGAVCDPASFAPEKAWQLAKLEQLAALL